MAFYLLAILFILHFSFCKYNATDLQKQQRTKISTLPAQHQLYHKMKKIKSVLLIAAITISVTASFAQASDPYCSQEPQYFRMNTPWGYYFVPAGVFGEDYVCFNSPFSTCTYFRIPGTDYFYSCQQGQYFPACDGY